MSDMWAGETKLKREPAARGTPTLAPIWGLPYLTLKNLLMWESRVVCVHESAEECTEKHELVRRHERDPRGAESFALDAPRGDAGFSLSTISTDGFLTDREFQDAQSRFFR